MWEMGMAGGVDALSHRNLNHLKFYLWFISLIATSAQRADSNAMAFWILWRTECDWMRFMGNEKCIPRYCDPLKLVNLMWTLNTDFIHFYQLPPVHWHNAELNNVAILSAIKMNRGSNRRDFRFCSRHGMERHRPLTSSNVDTDLVSYPHTHTQSRHSVMCAILDRYSAPYLCICQPNENKVKISEMQIETKRNWQEQNAIVFCFCFCGVRALGEHSHECKLHADGNCTILLVLCLLSLGSIPYTRGMPFAVCLRCSHTASDGECLSRLGRLSLKCNFSQSAKTWREKNETKHQIRNDIAPATGLLSGFICTLHCGMCWLAQSDSMAISSATHEVRRRARERKLN